MAPFLRNKRHETCVIQKKAVSLHRFKDFRIRLLSVHHRNRDRELREQSGYIAQIAPKQSL